MATPNLEHLDLSDTDTEDLFASPSRESKNPDPTDNFKVNQAREADSSRSNANAQARQQESRYDSEEARVAMLRKELSSVREINEAIEGVQASLERAKENMEVRIASKTP
jgi:DASH complex subunit Duo1